MKIAILTQPIGHNYGGILQNWALQHVLSELGHAPQTIIYCSPSIKLTSKERAHKLRYVLRSGLSYFIKYRLLRKDGKPGRLPWHNKNKYLHRFIRNHIETSLFMSEISDSALKEKRFSAIIVGSDQVWRPCYNESNLNSMFCSFADSPILTRVAYAASFGVYSWEFSSEQTAMAQEAIKQFHRVSVREASGMSLCREHLNVEADTCLDPTLLLPSSSYDELIPDKLLRRTPNDKVAVYILDFNEQKRQIVNTICNRLGKEPLYFGNVDEKGHLQPIEQWLAHFKSSDFIITDSFHGTVFSIIYRKPFISIANPTRGTDRFTSLLNMLDLRSRLIYENQEIADSTLFEPIDWDAVYSKLNNYKSKSKAYLTDALN